MLTKNVADRSLYGRDYRVRRGAISAYGRAIRSTHQLRWLMVGVGLFIFSGLLWMVSSGDQSPSLPLVIVLFSAVAGGLWFIYRYVTTHFIEPNLAMRIWLQQVCDGELEATIGLDKDHLHFKELNFHTGNLASSLKRLSDDMDSLVESQTKRVNDQKRVLELLFKLTTDVSGETEDVAAFETVCHSLAEWFECATVSCYLVPAADTLITASGIRPQTASVENNETLHCVAIRKSLPGSDVIGVADTRHAPSISLEQIPSQIVTTKPRAGSKVSQRQVPFFAGNAPAGVLVVDLEDSIQTQRVETSRVLSTVAEQLSLLCSKNLVQEQILEARLSRDRNDLAADVHDSLAQTLLAVRYQATLLAERIDAESDTALYQEVQKIKGTIEEANEEIRGLIREYRYPLAEHRYADLLQQEIEEFNQSNSVPVFFQSDDPQIRFTPREESVLRRLVGEALNNASKYASATMIRVHMQCSSSGIRRILVEDDGIGFEISDPCASKLNGLDDNGKQIGLNIMRERALSIGAKLLIDSEPGEGTRIAITMPPLIASQELAS